MLQEKLEQHIRDIPDFPEEGIVFKDITPVLANNALCREILDAFVDHFKDKRIDAIACIESRGFFFGMLMAQAFNAPFIPVRKEGKLPHETVKQDYTLEYGSAAIEMHTDAIQEDWNVLIHDDLLATGGTAAATAELIEKVNARVAGYAFIIELDFLKGADKLKPYSEDIYSLLHTG